MLQEGGPPGQRLLRRVNLVYRAYEERLEVIQALRVRIDTWVTG
jgi:hypothetical protein